MLYLISRIKLIVQLLLITIAILVGVSSYSKNRVESADWCNSEESLLQRVQFYPGMTAQFKNLAD